jgi:hypothetical protein
MTVGTVDRAKVDAGMVFREENLRREREEEAGEYLMNLTRCESSSTCLGVLQPRQSFDGDPQPFSDGLLGLVVLSRQFLLLGILFEPVQCPEQMIHLGFTSIHRRKRVFKISPHFQANNRKDAVGCQKVSETRPGVGVGVAKTGQLEAMGQHEGFVDSIHHYFSQMRATARLFPLQWGMKILKLLASCHRRLIQLSYMKKESNKYYTESEETEETEETKESEDNK